MYLQHCAADPDGFVLGRPKATDCISDHIVKSALVSFHFWRLIAHKDAAVVFIKRAFYKQVDMVAGVERFIHLLTLAIGGIVDQNSDNRVIRDNFCIGWFIEYRKLI